MFGDFGLFGGDVLSFLWVGGVVVKFEIGCIGGCADFFPLDETVALGADGSTHFLFGKAVIGVISNTSGWIFKHGHKAAAVDGLRTGGCEQRGEFGQRGKDVHTLGELTCAAARFGQARGDDEERNAVRLLVVRVLGPDAMIAEVEAVISPKDDDRVVSQAPAVEFVDYLPIWAST